MTFLLDGEPSMILEAWMYEQRYFPHPAARISHVWVGETRAATSDWELSAALTRWALDA